MSTCNIPRKILYFNHFREYSIFTHNFLFAIHCSYQLLCKQSCSNNPSNFRDIDFFASRKQSPFQNGRGIGGWVKQGLINSNQANLEFKVMIRVNPTNNLMFSLKLCLLFSSPASNTVHFSRSSWKFSHFLIDTNL